MSISFSVPRFALTSSPTWTVWTKSLESVSFPNRCCLLSSNWPRMPSGAWDWPSSSTCPFWPDSWWVPTLNAWSLNRERKVPLVKAYSSVSLNTWSLLTDYSVSLLHACRVLNRVTWGFLCLSCCFQGVEFFDEKLNSLCMAWLVDHGILHMNNSNVCVWQSFDAEADLGFLFCFLILCLSSHFMGSLNTIWS